MADETQTLTQERQPSQMMALMVFALMIVRFLLVAFAIINFIAFLVPGPCLWSGGVGVLYFMGSCVGAYVCRWGADRLIG